MKRIRQTIAAAAITIWAGGCEWILGIEDAKLRTFVPCYSGPAGTIGIGPCTGGIQECDLAGKPIGGCEGEIIPANADSSLVENGVDDDCDGQIDEDPCGDGKFEPKRGEECDDGNLSDNDACSTTCTKQLVLAIATGSFHTCALLSGGIVKCWGNNFFGQLGLGDHDDRGHEPEHMGKALPPVNLGRGRRAVKIDAGEGHTCVILDNQTVKCWGLNDFGQLGLGDTANRGDTSEEMGDALPAVSLGTKRIPKDLALGANHTCVLFHDGTIKCWGHNKEGQLGLGDAENRGGNENQMGDALPEIDLGTGQTASAISAGEKHTCAVLSGGAVKCWGWNAFGSLGLGDDEDRGTASGEMGDALEFVQIAISPVVAIHSGYANRCAQSAEGLAKCWGLNPRGTLGIGTTERYGDEPAEMGDALPLLNLGLDTKIAQMCAGWAHMCALLADGRVKCWGDGKRLGLGITVQGIGDEMGEMGDALLSVDVGAPVAELALTGDEHTCAILVDGTVKCWGRNDFGQLGLGDKNDRGDEPGEMGANLPTVKLFSDEW